jgi:hypothetical protein
VADGGFVAGTLVCLRCCESTDESDEDGGEMHGGGCCAVISMIV